MYPISEAPRAGSVHGGGARRTLLEVLRGSVDKLHSNELEATLLEAANDVADEAALDTVGLQKMERVRAEHQPGVWRLRYKTRPTLTMM